MARNSGKFQIAGRCLFPVWRSLLDARDSCRLSIKILIKDASRSSRILSHEIKKRGHVHGIKYSQSRKAKKEGLSAICFLSALWYISFSGTRSHGFFLFFSDSPSLPFSGPRPAGSQGSPVSSIKESFYSSSLYFMPLFFFFFGWH